MDAQAFIFFFFFFLFFFSFFYFFFFFSRIDFADQIIGRELPFFYPARPSAHMRSPFSRPRIGV